MNANDYVKINGERFIVDMMYARRENMTGRAVYQEICWGNLAVVHIDLWQRLERLVPVLRKNKLKLKICDAYRPEIAHEIMKKIIPMRGFFAEIPQLSQHCLGTAVDVCLCDESGRELDYPTKVDAYEPIFSQQVSGGKTDDFMAHLQKARHDYYAEGLEKEITNRIFLRTIMEDAGLKSIMHEWWHFNLPDGKSDRYPPVTLEAADYR